MAMMMVRNKLPMDKAVSLVPTVDSKPRYANLKRVAKERFNYSEDELKAILKAAGYSQFDPYGFWTYVNILQVEFEKAHQREVVDQKCPICDGVVVADPATDRKFGQLYGWKCTKDSNHFMQFAWGKNKPWFQRGAEKKKEKK